MTAEKEVLPVEADRACARRLIGAVPVAGIAPAWLNGAASHFTDKRWRLADLNRCPPACKAGALPTELNPQTEVRRIQLP